MFRKTMLSGCLMAAVAGLGCGAAGAGDNELATLAARASEEFTKRGDGTFFDTGYAAYCRAGSGFDEGVFKEIGFAPTGKGYEYCYNVSADRKVVALAATATKDGSVRCLIVDGSSGKPEGGKVTDKSPCVP